jgi:hypothetical protein
VQGDHLRAVVGGALTTTVVPVIAERITGRTVLRLGRCVLQGLAGLDGHQIGADRADVPGSEVRRVRVGSTGGVQVSRMPLPGDPEDAAIDELCRNFRLPALRERFSRMSSAISTWTRRVPNCCSRSSDEPGSARPSPTGSPSAAR